MLQRTPRKAPPAAARAGQEKSPMPPTLEMPRPAANPAARGADKEASKRDLLQEMVKDSPEMAASVLSRWILESK